MVVYRVGSCSQGVILVLRMEHTVINAPKVFSPLKSRPLTSMELTSVKNAAFGVLHVIRARKQGVQIAIMVSGK